MKSVTQIEFTVLGTPRPQGSMKQLRHRISGEFVSMPDNLKTKPWKQEVARTALWERVPRLTGPLAVKLQFFFAKPKSRPKSWTEPAVKPDLDKLIRAIFDSVKGICWNDDAQVVAVAAEKAYGLPERVVVEIQEILK